jgi:formate dehydrogenase subunit gamma
MMPMKRISQEPAPITRHSHAARLTHWAVAVAYVALFLSGLALFHPFFYWLAGLFGSGAFMRIIHPFLGVAFAVVFYAYAIPLVADNRLTKGDGRWVRNMFAYMNRKGEDVPVEGKYNAGQKLMFWSMVAVIAALLLTGIVMWRPYFFGAFSPGLRRAAGLLHAVMAFVMFVGIGVHVYAAYWTKGAMKAMTRGTVSRSWARAHHPGWYQRMIAAKKDV